MLDFLIYPRWIFTVAFNCFIRHGVVVKSLDSQSSVDSTFHPSEVGEMSSSIINALQVCQGCADRQRSPVNSFGNSWSAHSGMCRRVGL